MTLYAELKPWQLPKRADRRPDDKRVPTHYGMQPTPGTWLGPAAEHVQFMAAMDRVRGRWCVSEVPAADALAPMVFDIDIHLDADTNMDPLIDRFTSVLRNVLSDSTDIYGDERPCTSEM
jgi:hypothetical protein